MRRSLTVRPFYRWLSLLLAGLVLAASVGVASERHRCRISGRSVLVRLSLPGLPPAGPAEDDGDAGRKAPGTPCGNKGTADGCCDISHAHHKLNAQSLGDAGAKWLPEPSAALPALPPAPAWPGLPAGPARPVAAAQVLRAANSSPPGVPRAGRVLLVRHRTWRV